MTKVYHIRIRGHLDPGWTHELAGLMLTPEDDGTTVLRGPLADQAALRGILNRLDDLGLTLLEVILVSPLPGGAAAREIRL